MKFLCSFQKQATVLAHCLECVPEEVLDQAGFASPRNSIEEFCSQSHAQSGIEGLALNPQGTAPEAL